MSKFLIVTLLHFQLLLQLGISSVLSPYLRVYASRLSSFVEFWLYLFHFSCHSCLLLFRCRLLGLKSTFTRCNLFWRLNWFHPTQLEYLCMASVRKCGFFVFLRTSYVELRLCAGFSRYAYSLKLHHPLFTRACSNRPGSVDSTWQEKFCLFCALYCIFGRRQLFHQRSWVSCRSVIWIVSGWFYQSWCKPASARVVFLFRKFSVDSCMVFKFILQLAIFDFNNYAMTLICTSICWNSIYNISYSTYYILGISPEIFHADTLARFWLLWTRCCCH
jgi:hypothetical protein